MALNDGVGSIAHVDDIAQIWYAASCALRTRQSTGSDAAGSNIKFYFRKWKEANTNDNFFRWYVFVDLFSPLSVMNPDGRADLAGGI